MSMTSQSVRVSLVLPKDVYERATQAAAREQRRVEDLLSVLVAEGLNTHIALRELFEGVALQYRNRLSHEGKDQQSSGEILEELRQQREQIADELYP
jgi:hypothetical protein